MRVVALVPGGIGDQILFFPTLDDLKRSYPNAQIDVVVEPRAKGAYRVCKSVDRVILFDFKDRNSLADWGNLLGILRDREYDIALSLSQHWTIGLTLWLSGIPTRVGYSDGSSWFFTNPVSLKTEQYAVNQYRDLLSSLEINSSSSELAVNVPKKDIEWVKTEQKRLGLGESGYILIYGGTEANLKPNELDVAYPGDKWQQVIQNLRQRQPDLPIVILQDAEDKEFVSELLATVSDVKVTAPEDIGKQAATIANANLLLCTDSAPMQLAVAVKTPVIALFGPTDSAKRLPKSDRNIAIQSPTGKTADISPQTILEKILGS